MAAVASLAAAGSALDRYEAPSSSSTSSSSSSSSSGDTTEEEENSSSSSSSTSSSSTRSSSSSEPSKKKKKKKNQHSSSQKKKKQKNKSKSIRKAKSSANRIDADENGDEVSSMLLLGAELLKEVEGASAFAAAQVESKHAQVLLPISHYVVHGGADRSTLLEHVMSSVPAAQWQAILPPVLKEMSSGELKQLCLQQLQFLSDATILNIINGGDGDQGPSGKAVSSTTIGKERKKKKSKKTKKSKKKAKKTKRSDREEERGKGQHRGGEDEGEESSGKTLMELLELEMRARAIKALLKKEEEGEEDDDGNEWLDAGRMQLPTVAQYDVIQRPFKSTESDYSDKHKQQTIGHGHHHHTRPSDPSVSNKGYAVSQQPTGLNRPSGSFSSGDGQRQSVRRRHSSFVDERNDEIGFRKSQHPRQYRHHHQHHYMHHRDHDHDHDRSRSASRRTPVKTEPMPTSEQDRKPSPFLSPPPVVETVSIAAPPAAIQVQLEKAQEKEILMENISSTKDEEEEEIEYEEDGIQEVDIELGSGSSSESDDDAHSARI